MILEESQHRDGNSQHHTKQNEVSILCLKPTLKDKRILHGEKTGGKSGNLLAL
jgi:hypothetical protein